MYTRNVKKRMREWRAGGEGGRRRSERERKRHANFHSACWPKKCFFPLHFPFFRSFFQNKTSPFVAVAETRASLSVIAYSANEPHGRPRCTGRRPRRVRLPAAAAAAACDDADDASAPSTAKPRIRGSSSSRVRRRPSAPGGPGTPRASLRQARPGVLQDEDVHASELKS